MFFPSLLLAKTKLSTISLFIFYFFLFVSDKFILAKRRHVFEIKEEKKNNLPRAKVRERERANKRQDSTPPIFAKCNFGEMFVFSCLRK